MRDFDDRVPGISRRVEGLSGAERRAFVASWIARNQRSIAAGLGGSLLFLPVLGHAQALPAGFVDPSSIQGVANVVLGPEGVANITLSNGQLVVVGAQNVQVVGGQVLITSAAAQGVAQAAAAALGLAPGAIAGGLGAGAAVAAVADFGPPKPSVRIDPLAGGDDILNIAESSGALVISGGSNLIPDGRDVVVRVNDVAYATTIADSAWSVTVPLDDVAALLDGTTYEVRVEVLKPDGDVAQSAVRNLRVDLTAPWVEITTPIAGDGVINIAESGQPLTITGTTDAEDGQVVTVMLIVPGFGDAPTATGTVSGGNWSVTFPSAQVSLLPDGASITVTADVADAAGNNAVQASETVDTNLTAPTIAIDDTLAGNNVFTQANVTDGVDVTGTTDAEVDQTVTVTYNGVDYTGPVMAGVPLNTFSINIPGSAFDGLDTGDAITGITAQVSDIANNPSNVASGPVINVDLTGPTIAIDPIAGDDVINIAESGADVIISGTATGADGQIATIAIPLIGFTANPIITAGAWSVTLPAADVGVLADATTFTVTANVSDDENIPAPEATRDFSTDLTRPEVVISEPLPFGDALNIADSDTPQTFSGTVSGNDGQPVLVKLIDADGETLLPTVTNIDGTWTATATVAQLKALAEGVADVQADVSDAAGNPAFPFLVSFDVDFTAPVVAIDPLTGDNELTLANKGNDVTVSGTTDAEPDQMVTVVFNGTPLAPALVVAGGGSVDLPNTWTTTIPGALTDLLEDEEGVTEEYSLSAQATDAAGNPSAIVTSTITTDFSQPTITFNPISGDDIINAFESGDPLVFSGTTTNLEVGRTISLVVTGTAGFNLAFETTVQAGGTFSIATGFADQLADIGSYTVTANATNEAGIDAVPGVREFSTDYVFPFITIDTPIAGDDVVNLAERDAGITVTGMTDAEEGQQVSVNTGFGTTIFGTVSDDGTWSANIPSGQLQLLPATGDFTLTANVSDIAGNPAPQAQAPFSTDYVPPVLGFDSFSIDGTVMNAAERDDPAGFTVTGTANGAEDLQIVTVRFDVNGITALTREVPVDAETWSVTLSAAEVSASFPDNALVTINLSVSDAAGNPAVGVDASFNTDFTPPDLGINPPPFDDFLNIADAAVDLLVTGTVSGEGTQPVIVTLDGTDYTAIKGGDGSWSATIPAADLGALTDGETYMITVSTSDEAGNPALAGTAPFVVDFTPPDLTINPVGDDGVVNLRADLEITGTATGAEERPLTVTFLGTDYPTTVGLDGTWSVLVPAAALAGLAPGAALSATANVSDAAGNPAPEASSGAVGYLASVFSIVQTGGAGDVIDFGVEIDLSKVPGGAITTGFSFGVFVDPADASINSGAALAPGLFGEVDTMFIADGIISPFAVTLSPVTPTAPVATFSVTFPGIADGVLRLAVIGKETSADAAILQVNDLVHGPSELLLGSDIGESLVAASLDSTIRGRGGNDDIDVSLGGVNTVLFEPTQALNGTDTVTGFSLGVETALPDRIGFAGLDNADLRGSGANAEVIGGGAIGANTGFVVFTTALTNASETTTALSELGLVANDVIYLLANVGGGDAELLRVVVAADGSLPGDEIPVLARFEGVGDLTGFTADNLLGFTLVT